MKKIIFILLLGLTSQLYGYQYKNGSTIVSADLLVWKLREGSADNWAQLITPKGTQQSATIIGVPFQWDPGLRLGIGYCNPDNSWDTRAYYTNFQTTGNSSAAGNVYSAFLGNFYSGNTDGAKFGPYYSNGDIRWNFQYNTFDFQIGRAFKIDKVLTLHPTVGLKAAFIDQLMFTNWQNPTSSNTPPITYDFTHATEDLKNNYWGIGPSVGLGMIWPIYNSPSSHFNMIGNFGGALLWSHWRFKNLYQTNTATTISVNNSDIYGAATMVRGQLGLEWAKSLANADIAISLNYEAQIWFSQLQFYSFNMGKLNHLMSLQGGTLNFSVDF